MSNTAERYNLNRDATKSVNVITDDSAYKAVSALTNSINEEQQQVFTDPHPAESYLNIKTQLKRGFLKNTGSDCTIKYGGKFYTFEAGKAYCLDCQEASFFISKSIESGYDLKSANIDDWVSSGVIQTYYW